eukprot:364388-Chlamydomonas_euryale.AAC.1
MPGVRRWRASVGSPVVGNGANATVRTPCTHSRPASAPHWLHRPSPSLPRTPVVPPQPPCSSSCDVARPWAASPWTWRRPTRSPISRRSCTPPRPAVSASRRTWYVRARGRTPCCTHVGLHDSSSAAGPVVRCSALRVVTACRLVGAGVSLRDWCARGVMVARSTNTAPSREPGARRFGAANAILKVASDCPAGTGVGSGAASGAPLVGRSREGAHARPPCNGISRASRQLRRPAPDRAARAARRRRLTRC